MVCINCFWDRYKMPCFDGDFDPYSGLWDDDEYSIETDGSECVEYPCESFKARCDATASCGRFALIASHLEPYYFESREHRESFIRQNPRYAPDANVPLYARWRPVQVQEKCESRFSHSKCKKVGM